jgi:hypothetical protein
VGPAQLIVIISIFTFNISGFFVAEHVVGGQCQSGLPHRIAHFLGILLNAGIIYRKFDGWYGRLPGFNLLRSTCLIRRRPAGEYDKWDSGGIMRNWQTPWPCRQTVP